MTKRERIGKPLLSIALSGFWRPDLDELVQRFHRLVVREIGKKRHRFLLRENIKPAAVFSGFPDELTCPCQAPPLDVVVLDAFADEVSAFDYPGDIAGIQQFTILLENRRVWIDSKIHVYPLGDASLHSQRCHDAMNLTRRSVQELLGRHLDFPAIVQQVVAQLPSGLNVPLFCPEAQKRKRKREAVLHRLRHPTPEQVEGSPQRRGGG